MKLVVLFGGSSNEHDVSISSAASIITNLDHEKYQITPVYMDRENKIYVWKKNVGDIHPLSVGEKLDHLEEILDPISFFQSFDSIFIMVHGKNGEDGILSSIFEFFSIPYIGNKPAASIITMDKIFTKDILEKNRINTAQYVSFSKYNQEYIMDGASLSWDLLLDKINQKMHYPLFVKPANSGSSIGVVKVKGKEELDSALVEALQVDERILIEEAIVGRELECAILEYNGEVLAS